MLRQGERRLVLGTVDDAARGFPPFRDHARARRLRAVAHARRRDLRLPTLGEPRRHRSKRARPRRCAMSRSAPSPTPCARWRGWRLGRAAPRPTRCSRRACRRSRTATTAPISCSCRCSGAGSRYGRPDRRRDVARRDRRGDPRLPLLDGRAGQRREVVFHREPRAALPHRLLPRRRAVSRRRLSAARAGSGASRAQSAASGCSPGSTISRSCEMAEWNSAPYFPIDFKGLAALFALAPDADIRERARARHLAAAGDRRALEPPGHADRLAGPQLRAFAAAVPDAGALRHRAAVLRPRRVRQPLPCAAAAGALPSATTGFAIRSAPRGTRALEQRRARSNGAFAQGEDGIAALYHHKTRDHAMGIDRRLPAGRMGLSGDRAASAPRRPARSADLDQPSGRAHPLRLCAALLLGRLRHAAARASVSRPRRRRLRAAAGAGRFHPCLAAGGRDGRGAP